ncbi:putative serine/threonine-protein kinase nek2 [Papilio xuthus]|uniref:non-specific serine/threonine protein kinase n=1 Tax=Papilio xuthus TaxID=66420 RepID=A0A194Q752_PAPXU|nr:putative serine/threonine-protein kinase nek2 [Papilio xuthus]
MSEKLKDFQVLDVLRGGAFYKVKHKVTNNIYAWKAYDCTAYSDEQIQNIVNEVKTISKVLSGNLLRYYDTILHNASKTLYFVLEYSCWRSLQELVDICAAADKYIAENFIWHMLLDLAKACKLVETFNFTVIKKCITPSSIYIDDGGEVRVDCFQLEPTVGGLADLMRQIGDVIHTLCYSWQSCDGKKTVFPYSDDLQDIVSLVSDERNACLRPEVVIYHPTILSNVESTPKPKHLSEILVSNKDFVHRSDLNKCDSEKAVELCKNINSSLKTQCMTEESPIYSNISPKQKANKDIENVKLIRASLSPTLAALALELPGYVPRCRKPYSESRDTFTIAQKVSEETLSHQWMSRLMALRDREESLNRRERDLIVKEVMTSPINEIVCNNDSDVGERGSNGITLPAVIASAEKSRWKSRRRRRRSGSVRSRPRRQSCSYEDLDSSLSADTGDGSIIVTAKKFTLDNMPRRNIFPDFISKKVHFTPSNPFVGSDESVTLTFYDLDHLQTEDNQSKQNASVNDITKFKYFDVASVREKRAAKQWTHSSPSKQAKVYSDVSNQSNLRKTPSKFSLTSQSSVTSGSSMVSAHSHWCAIPRCSEVSAGCIADRTRSSFKHYPQTPTAPKDLKKSKIRKSLLNFKTPFKFKSSTKV